MANIAALTASLRQKHSDMSAIADSIKKIEQLKSEKVHGKLSFSVTSIDNHNDFKIALGVTPSESAISPSSFEDIKIRDVVEILLLSKQCSIQLTCATQASSPQTYTATFDVQETPDNDSMSSQIDGTADGHVIAIHVKTTYDTVEGMLLSKNTELQEVQREIADITSEVRKISTKSTTTPKEKKSSKKKQTAKATTESSVLSNVDEDDDNVDVDSQSILSKTINGCIYGLQKTIEHRAVLLFGGAAFVIYTFGEMVSV